MHMQKDKKGAGKELAAVCGLYCEACTLFIATGEDSKRLKALAGRFQLTEEEVRCNGCRSDKKGPYCRICKMAKCAAEKGIDFCVECTEYPCAELKKFQSERPHRIELFDDLAGIEANGYEQWLADARANYSCPKCRTLNSAYDLKCRKCGHEPSCNYVARHKPAIEKALKNM